MCNCVSVNYIIIFSYLWIFSAFSESKNSRKFMNLCPMQCKRRNHMAAVVTPNWWQSLEAFVFLVSNIYFYLRFVSIQSRSAVDTRLPVRGNEDLCSQFQFVFVDLIHREAVCDAIHFVRYFASSCKWTRCPDDFIKIHESTLSIGQSKWKGPIRLVCRKWIT